MVHAEPLERSVAGFAHVFGFAVHAPEAAIFILHVAELGSQYYLIPTAREPKCTKCQSVGTPSSEEYWHIGETKTRFLNSVSRILNGEKSLLTKIPLYKLWPDDQTLWAPRIMVCG